MATVVMPYIVHALSSPLLNNLAACAVAASSNGSNIFRGRNNDKVNTIYVVQNNPDSIHEALRANALARVNELRSVGRDADAAELEHTLLTHQPLRPFHTAPIPRPSPANLVTSISECRHFRLGAARLLWAFLNRQLSVRLLPASPTLALRAAAEQLLSYANRKQPTTHASLEAGAAFSICAKWVFADDRAALLAVLRVGSGMPMTQAERPALARLAYQILLMDNQAARRHGYSCLAVDRALGSTLDVFPDVQELLQCANSCAGSTIAYGGVPLALPAPAATATASVTPAARPLPVMAAPPAPAVVAAAALADPASTQTSGRGVKRPRSGGLYE